VAFGEVATRFSLDHAPFGNWQSPIQLTGNALAARGRSHCESRSAGESACPTTVNQQLESFGGETFKLPGLPRAVCLVEARKSGSTRLTKWHRSWDNEYGNWRSDVHLFRRAQHNRRSPKHN
jgi:hypothetical protein